MYLQTKKVVIIYIVTIITFVSIVSSLYSQTQDKLTQVSVISSEEFSYKVSFAQNIYSEFAIDAEASSINSTYTSSLYQLSSNSTAQLNNIVASSELLVIVGDDFNESLESLISENPEKQFVMVENSMEFNQDNSYQININYDQVFSAINRVSNEEEQSLVILSDEFTKLSENEYYSNDIANNPNVKLEVISNTTDNVAFKQQINKDLNNGFVNVYNFSPYNNSSLLDIINAYNQKTEETSTEETSSEQNQEESSEQTQDESTEQKKESKSAVKLKYLSLNDNAYINNDSNVEAYTYDISQQINDAIDATLNQKMKHGSTEVSISNKS